MLALTASGVSVQFCARLDFAVDDAEGGKGLTVSEASVHCSLITTTALYLLPDKLMSVLATFCLCCRCAGH